MFFENVTLFHFYPELNETIRNQMYFVIPKVPCYLNADQKSNARRCRNLHAFAPPMFIYAGGISGDAVANIWKHTQMGTMTI